MIDERTEAGPRVVADIPIGWESVDPPAGAQLVAIAPERRRGVLANVVVVAVRAPDRVDVSTVDAYLNDVVASIDADADVELLGVVVDHDPEQAIDVTAEPLRQRVLMQRRFVDGDGVVLAVAEVCQQHDWVDGWILVTTVTIPQPSDDDDEVSIDDLLITLSTVRLERQLGV